MWARLGILIIPTFIMGCTSEDSSNVATNGRISPTYTGPAETAYCATPLVYGMPKVTISGTAKYTRRNLWGTGIGTGNGGLGGALTTSTHPATEHNIRHAEIRVTDAAGNVVQCAETSATGTFSFELPQGNTNYTLSVNSRANNSFLVASILNRPEQNLFYSLQTTVNASANNASIALMAPASGSTLGAAFNILDQFHDANDYLRAQVGGFTVAPKVVGYWELGYNPNGYFGSDNGLSFYLPGYSRLFILGGLHGDVNNSDTDHFDNSVILHEYGHFLEDSMFASDSPGGPHNGNAIIDPRLAWSEGWGNFFQAAVRFPANSAVPRYTDTLGNDDGVTQLIYHADLEAAAVGADQPAGAGEGNFREFSVTRLLWDAIDTNVDGPTNGGTDNVVSADFADIWSVLRSTTAGFRDTDWAFRSVGHLHYGIGAGTPSWTSIRTIERHDADTSQYAQFVDIPANGGTCVFVSGTYTRTLTPTATASDLLRNFDFFHVKITSAGSYTFALDYQDTDAAGVEADLDLYLYNEDARLSDTADIISYDRDTPTGGVGTAENEAFTVTLQPGNYLLMVTAYVGGGTGTAAYYSIKQNGAQLCPDTL